MPFMQTSTYMPLSSTDDVCDGRIPKTQGEYARSDSEIPKGYHTQVTHGAGVTEAIDLIRSGRILSVLPLDAMLLDKAPLHDTALANHLAQLESIRCKMNVVASVSTAMADHFDEMVRQAFNTPATSIPLQDLLQDACGCQEGGCLFCSGFIDDHLSLSETVDYVEYDRQYAEDAEEYGIMIGVYSFTKAVAAHKDLIDRVFPGCLRQDISLAELIHRSEELAPVLKAIGVMMTGMLVDQVDLYESYNCEMNAQIQRPIY